MALPLFWRTFALIALLVAISLGIWLQLSRILVQQRLAQTAAEQLVAVADIARTTIGVADPAARERLIDDLNRHDDIDLFPRRAGDTVAPLHPSAYAAELRRRIAGDLKQTVDVAGDVDGRRGAWLGFHLGDQPYWLRVRRIHVNEGDANTWLIEIALAGVLALIGAATITNLLNRPLRDLLVATARVREGDYSHALDENAGPPEMREVSRGFNRMARALHEIERDRALMLAGISHDIRTPLARLRLEAELSVSDLRARRDMANDIEQADAIIAKLLEYARTTVPAREPVELRDVVSKVVADYANAPDLRVSMPGDSDVVVLGDALELQRVLVNLIENARRYGRHPGSVVAEVEISCTHRNNEVVLSVRDHGPGVPSDELPLLTRPFYRGDPARTPGKGTGLGLAIVERSLSRMGGRLLITNARDGGLLVRLWLPRDPLDTLPPAPM